MYNEKTTYSLCGTAEYIAPEVLSRRILSQIFKLDTQSNVIGGAL